MPQYHIDACRHSRCQPVIAPPFLHSLQPFLPLSMSASLLACVLQDLQLAFHKFDYFSTTGQVRVLLNYCNYPHKSCFLITVGLLSSEVINTGAVARPI